ncbi:MAG: type 1 glutamine amidotransferase [Phycisphaerales bacterium]|nr:type 1 glutamine amidotransferase [Phycisphaerales bacterium]
MADARLLLIQIRDDDDAMRAHEHECFAAHLGISVDELATWNLLKAPPPVSLLESSPAVLIGGSGDYSVVRGGPWLAAALDTMRRLVDGGIPTFASCWGFQAMSAALGGRVEHLPECGHVGTFEFTCEPAAQSDPLMQTLGSAFRAQLGHEDVVTRAPADAQVLVRSQQGHCMAWRLKGLPIWGTQFHPELSDKDLMVRLRRYPQYVRDIVGMSLDAFEAEHIAPSPDADHLLGAFKALLQRQ